ncbi:uncharacterized protein LOC130046556 [Ostrea edulis]|uniref:uncharacterized protein LOC130046556 n=1 Tax=Ostrea edulis TaxID=37623 RepID=UPI0024AEC2E7|nr:uncharacterized protein LOC130046556 [Ostrea edulis]
MEYFTRVRILLVLSLVAETCASADQSYALCGGQKGFIRCLKGTKIQILTASYGRTDPMLCPDGKTDTRTCHSKTSELKVKWNCNGYRTCHLQATDQNFGDPCPKYSKYLEVKYRCVKTPNPHPAEKTIIAFNAYTTKHLHLNENSPTNVVYDGIHLNRGMAYDRHSGIFTAPSDGLYIFTWTSLVLPKKIFDTNILVNGFHKGYSNCNNRHNPGLENCANTVPLILKTGDKVNIRTTTANNLHEIWSSFKGWKV